METTVVINACAAATKYRPGSAMTLTEGSGKRSSNMLLMSAAWSSNVAQPSSSMPGKPPPMSKSLKQKPRRAASSKTTRARCRAPRKAPNSEQPLPTWKLTPTTCNPNSCARSRSDAQSSGAQPNLLESGHCALLSSVCTRRTSSAVGYMSTSLSSSAGLSKTSHRTPIPRANDTADGCLQGLAYTIWSLMSTPSKAATTFISAGLAQSKPPNFRSCHISQRAFTSAELGLHFTA
mmetsp:Transcript_111528/g.300866  ORF Transcript_111528/g.300866 Transcript_111528/m.300866 type:complete len:235 (-) Transcript_111528:1468-2172(-)